MFQLGHSSWQYLHPNQCLHVSTWPPFMTILASFLRFSPSEEDISKIPRNRPKKGSNGDYTKGFYKIEATNIIVPLNLSFFPAERRSQSTFSKDPAPRARTKRLTGQTGQTCMANATRKCILIIYDISTYHETVCQPGPRQLCKHQATACAAYCLDRLQRYDKSRLGLQWYINPSCLRRLTERQLSISYGQ